MTETPSVVVRSKRRVFDGFFKVDEITVSYKKYNGAMSAEKPFLVFERGDAVGVLIFNRDRGEVVLVEQFKVPTLDKGRGHGWIVETMAGMIRPDESPEEAAIRETLEETGYKIHNPEHIATFFSSPGGTSERIFLYYAVVGDADKVEDGGGLAQEGEDIRIVTMTPEDLFQRLSQASLEDPKLVIAAYHLRERIKLDPVKPKALQAGTIKFGLKSRPGVVIGIKTGEIRRVQGVDVWVNSENTDMMMDRVIGKTISANIRYGGAEKDSRGSVMVDTIGNELRRKLRDRVFVRPGTVVETESGELAITNGVSRILHVAAVDGVGPGMGVRADPDMIVHCLNCVFAHIHKRNEGFRLFSNRDASVLVPLMGTGDGGLVPGQIAPKLVDAAIAFFQEDRGEFKEVYFLAYTSRERDACMKVLLERQELVEMKASDTSAIPS